MKDHRNRFASNRRQQVEAKRWLALACRVLDWGLDQNQWRQEAILVFCGRVDLLLCGVYRIQDGDGESEDPEPLHAAKRKGEMPLKPSQ